MYFALIWSERSCGAQLLCNSAASSSVPGFVDLGLSTWICLTGALFQSVLSSAKPPWLTPVLVMWVVRGAEEEREWGVVVARTSTSAAPVVRTVAPPPASTGTWPWGASASWGSQWKSLGESSGLRRIGWGTGSAWRRWEPRSNKRSVSHLILGSFGQSAVILGWKFQTVYIRTSLEHCLESWVNFSPTIKTKLCLVCQNLEDPFSKHFSYNFQSICSHCYFVHDPNESFEKKRKKICFFWLIIHFTVTNPKTKGCIFMSKNHKNHNDWGYIEIQDQVKKWRPNSENVTDSNRW